MVCVSIWCLVIYIFRSDFFNEFWYVDVPLIRWTRTTKKFLCNFNNKERERERVQQCLSLDDSGIKG